MLAPAMRPVFNPGIYIAPVQEGVYLRGNDSRLLLKGPGLYPLLEHLVPLLNGEATLAALTEGLDERRKHMIIQLLEKLCTHRMLQDFSLASAPAVQERDAANLAFVASWQQSAAPAQLAHFQGRRLLLSASGPALTSLIQAGLRCGVEQICVLMRAEEEMDSGLCQRLQDVVARWGTGAQVVQFIALPERERDNEAVLRACLRDCDAFIHLAAQQALARVQLLNRLCVAEQKVCIQAVVVGEQAWVGPVVCAEVQGCWECAWRRLQANLTRLGMEPSWYALGDALPPAGTRVLSIAEFTIIAQRLLFALFTFCCGDAERAARTLYVLHLATGQSEGHIFLPHPLCQACQRPAARTQRDFLEQIHHLEQHAPVDRTALPQLLGDAMLDPWLGLFTLQEEETAVQAPLAIYTATLCDPTLLRSWPEVLTLAVQQGETEDGRLQVIGDVCARYAACVADPRQLFPLSAVPALVASDAQAMSACPDHQLWTWALDLQTRQVRPVPAAHAFPAHFSPDQASVCGVAWGFSWEEAVCRAVLDWCAALTGAQVRQAPEAYTRVDLSELCLPVAAQHLSHLLHTAPGESCALYDVTGALGVPTMAVCLGEQVVAYISDCDPVQAVSLGLQRVLQCVQAGQWRRLANVDPPVPDLPLALRSRQLCVPRSLCPQGWSDRLVWLVQGLQADGWCALAIPLDHDPAMARILPFLVRVLVYRSASQRGA